MTLDYVKLTHETRQYKDLTSLSGLTSCQNTVHLGHMELFLTITLELRLRGSWSGLSEVSPPLAATTTHRLGFPLISVAVPFLSSSRASSFFNYLLKSVRVS